MAKTIHLTVVTFEKPIYEDDVSSFVIDTKDGTITVLPEHTPLVTALADGELTVEKDGHKKGFTLFGGALVVTEDNTAVVLADISEPADEINIKEAQKAYERAKELAEQQRDQSDVDFAMAQSEIQRQLKRVKLGNKWR